MSAHWLKFQSSFNFVIFYMHSKENDKADFLNFWLNDLESGKNDDC